MVKHPEQSNILLARCLWNFHSHVIKSDVVMHCRILAFFPDNCLAVNAPLSQHFDHRVSLAWILTSQGLHMGHRITFATAVITCMGPVNHVGYNERTFFYLCISQVYLTDVCVRLNACHIPLLHQKESFTRKTWLTWVNWLQYWTIILQLIYCLIVHCSAAVEFQSA